LRDGPRVTQAAVMRVVEQEVKTAATSANLADAADQPRIVPLVHDYQIGIVQCIIQVDGSWVVTDAVELGISLAEGLNDAHAVVGQKMVQAPTVCWFVNLHLVTTRSQLHDDAAQKMS